MHVCSGPEIDVLYPNSGIFGERLPLRYYLSTGMVLSGIFTSLFGLGYYWNIHSIWYYAFVQVSPASRFSLHLKRQFWPVSSN